MIIPTAFGRFFNATKCHAFFYICVMKKKMIQRNTLMRYQKIKELYRSRKTEDIPTTVILRKYIYPVYPISRNTLIKILNTDLDAEMKRLIEWENQQSLRPRE